MKTNRNNKTRQAIKASSLQGEVMRALSAQANRQDVMCMLDHTAEPIAYTAEREGYADSKLEVIALKAINALGRARYGTTEVTTTLLNMVERIGKFNPEAIQGGQGAIDQCTTELWAIYANVEALHGVVKGKRNGVSIHGDKADDAHFIVSDIPCDVNGYGKLEYKPRHRLNGEHSHGLPVSPAYKLMEMHKAGISEGIEPKELLDYALDSIQCGKVKQAWARPMKGIHNTRHAIALNHLVCLFHGEAIPE